jgi:hypothetical protein
MVIMDKETNEIYGLTHKEYQEGATSISKSFIFMFLLFCAYFAWYKDISIGFLWIPYLIGGIFLSSLIFAFPYTSITFYICNKTKYNSFVVFSLCYPFKWICYIVLFFAVKLSLQGL